MKKTIYISLLAVSVNFPAGVIQHRQDQQRIILPWLMLSAVLLSLPWSKESNKAKQHTLWQSGGRKKVDIRRCYNPVPKDTVPKDMTQ